MTPDRPPGALDGRLQSIPPLLCGHCGACELPTIGPGAGQHVARLDCAACGKFLKWAPKALVHPHLMMKESQMIACVNRVTLLGVIGKYGVTIKYAPNGTPCTTFLLEVRERGQDGKEYSTLVECECWGKRAEAAGELKAGQLVLFEGRLRKRQKGELWETIVSGFEVCPIRASAEDPS
jgi:primosomal replication protein N